MNNKLTDPIYRPECQRSYYFHVAFYFEWYYDPETNEPLPGKYVPEG